MKKDTYQDNRDSDVLRQKYEEPEFNDLYRVLDFGARKHGNSNWLQPGGNKSSHKDMIASIFRHVAEAHVGNEEDHESGEHPLLHAAARCLMLYTLKKRGIVHDEDK